MVFYLYLISFISKDDLKQLTDKYNYWATKLNEGNTGE